MQDELLLSLTKHQKSLLIGSKGPFPKNQEKILKFISQNKTNIIYRQSLIKLFSGNRHALNKSLRALNKRLKALGVKIVPQNIYELRKVKPDNQLKLWK